MYIIARNGKQVVVTFNDRPGRRYRMRYKLRQDAENAAGVIRRKTGLYLSVERDSQPEEEHVVRL